MALCECGCGQETTVYRGKPRRFIRGHSRCKSPWKPVSAPQLCECGCGEYTLPGNRFINGHNRPMLGKNFSAEQCARMSEAHKGVPLSDSHKASMSAAAKGHIKSPSHCAAISKAKKGVPNLLIRGEKHHFYGKHHTDEAKEKMSLSQKNRAPFTEEHLKNLSDATKGSKNPNYGKKMSDEQKKKLSISHMGLLSGEKHPAWRGGISFEPYCPKFNDTFKEFIRDKFGRVCFLCQTTEEENEQRLSVHHVNYDKSCLCNDVECEFVPLCKSCHTRTNANREYWESFIMEKL